MSDTSDLAARAADLRSAFDRAFALPPAGAAAEVEDLLAIRVAGVPYGVHLRDVSGIVARRTVTAVPNAAAHLVGLAGIHGAVVPVFSLASLLGHGLGSASERWLLLCGTDVTIALGFSEVDGHLRLPKASFHVGAGPTAAAYVAEVASTDALVLPVIRIPLVIATLQNGSSRTRLDKEHEQ